MTCPECGQINNELALRCCNCKHELKTIGTGLEGLFSLDKAVGLATFSQRAAASVIDFLLWFILIAGGGASIAAVAGPLPREAGELFLIVFVLSFGLYCTLMESSARQATLGKLLLRIAVTDLDGHRISVGRATFRFVIKWLTGFGMLSLERVALRRQRAWHDAAAGTLVLQRPRIAT